MTEVNTVHEHVVESAGFSLLQTAMIDDVILEKTILTSERPTTRKYTRKALHHLPVL
jgi:hypothetical protein